MSEFVYKDYMPANARVIIDYKKEQKVSFSYPIEWSYWKAVWKRAYPTVLSFWLAIHSFFTPYLMMYILLPAILITTIFFPYVSTTTKTTTLNFDFVHIVLPFVGFMFYLLGIPALITLYLAMDKDKLSRWIPKLGYWSANLIFGTKETIITNKDIIDNKAIVPNFSNVYLDYKTKGDFNKYLEKVEILEIPFFYKERNFFFPFKKKKQKNDYNFRAVFYFSQTPIDGELDIEFI